MSVAHQDLAGGRWAQLSFSEQMGNIGSEVSRALNWQRKGNEPYCLKAVERAFELLHMTLDCISVASRYKEITRLREALADYFYGPNQFISTPELWRSYFDHFNYAARKDR